MDPRTLENGLVLIDMDTACRPFDSPLHGKGGTNCYRFQTYFAILYL